MPNVSVSGGHLATSRSETGAKGSQGEASRSARNASLKNRAFQPGSRVTNSRLEYSGACTMASAQFKGYSVWFSHSKGLSSKMCQAVPLGWHCELHTEAAPPTFPAGPGRRVSAEEAAGHRKASAESQG